MGQGNVKFDASAIEKQRQRQFESELAAADLALVRKHALKVARRRDHFNWEWMTAATCIAGFFALGVRTGRMECAIPIVCLMMGVGMRYDVAYGEHLEEIRNDAERILAQSPQLLQRPGGPITVAEIDRLRAEMFGSS